MLWTDSFQDSLRSCVPKIPFALHCVCNSISTKITNDEIKNVLFTRANCFILKVYVKIERKKVMYKRKPIHNTKKSLAQRHIFLERNSWKTPYMRYHNAPFLQILDFKKLDWLLNIGARCVFSTRFRYNLVQFQYKIKYTDLRVCSQIISNAFMVILNNP